MIICHHKEEITIISLSTGINDTFECEDYILKVKILSETQIITSHVNCQIRIWDLLTKNNFILGDKRHYEYILNVNILNTELILLTMEFNYS